MQSQYLVVDARFFVPVGLVGGVGVGGVGVGPLPQLLGSHSALQILGNSLPHTILHASFSLLPIFLCTQLIREPTLKPFAFLFKTEELHLLPQPHFPDPPVGGVGVGGVGVGGVGVGPLLQLLGSHSPQIFGNSFPHTKLQASFSLLPLYFCNQLIRALTL